MSQQPSPREYHVILLGATGDAGRAIASTLATRAPASVRWAIAGRSEAKLRKVAAELHERYGVLPDVLLADCSSAAQLRMLTGKASVLISAAGPFAKLGEAVVAACIQSGTHYVDITGEVHWVADMREKYGRLAADAGVCLCSFCGYDCIPTELSVTACATAANGDKLTHVECVSLMEGGGMPHGTIMTMLTMFTIPGALRLVRGNFNFVPKSARVRMAASYLRWLMPLRWSNATRCFTVPHMMGDVTIPVAQNMAASLGFGDVVFSDRQLLPELGIRSTPLTLWGLLPIALIVFGVVLAAVPLLCLSLLLSLSSPAMARVEKMLTNYSYQGDPDACVRVLTTAHTKSGAVVRSEFVCPGDAGIWCTGKLAGETALSIIDRLHSSNRNRNQRASTPSANSSPHPDPHPHPSPLPAGFVTPGALGNPLIAHLQHSGVQLSAAVVPKA